MSMYYAAMMITAVLAALFCMGTRNYRGLMWIGAGALAFLASVLYAFSGLPYAPGIALLLDAAVCLAIYFRYERMWEKVLYVCFLLMAFINLIYQAAELGYIGHIQTGTHAAALEVLNYAALAVIVSPPILERVGRYVPGNPLARLVVSGVSWLDNALSQNRRKPPFTAFP